MHYCPLCKSTLEIITIENNDKLKCSKCYFTFWNNPSPVTASILLYNNDIVLVRPDYVKNGLPPLRSRVFDVYFRRYISV